MQQQQEWSCRRQELGIHDRNWREEISLDPKKKKKRKEEKIHSLARRMNSTTKLAGAENSGTQKLGFGACARTGSYSRAHQLGQLVHQPNF
jgi:hypothetical protein